MAARGFYGFVCASGPHNSRGECDVHVSLKDTEAVTEKIAEKSELRAAALVTACEAPAAVVLGNASAGGPWGGWMPIVGLDPPRYASYTSVWVRTRAATACDSTHLCSGGAAQLVYG